MRIERFQQTVRRFGKFVIQLLAHPGGGIGKALDQPLTTCGSSATSPVIRSLPAIFGNAAAKRDARFRSAKSSSLYFRKPSAISSPPPEIVAWKDRSGIQADRRHAFLKRAEACLYAHASARSPSVQFFRIVTCTSARRVSNGNPPLDAAERAAPWRHPSPDWPKNASTPLAHERVGQFMSAAGGANEFDGY